VDGQQLRSGRPGRHSPARSDREKVRVPLFWEIGPWRAVWREIRAAPGRDKPVVQHVQSTGGGAERKLTRAAIEFVKREDGPTAVEYAIMLALIVTICIGVITTIGSNGNVLSTNAPAMVAITGGN